jgi:MtN3 and saliva related transmembrane protein
MSSNVELIGYAAALLTTVAFAPQVIRTWRLGGHELSWSMLALFAAGVTLWFVYGVVRESAPLMLANGLTLAQVLAMAAVKWRTRVREGREIRNTEGPGSTPPRRH